MPTCSFRRAEASASTQPLQDLLGGLPRVDLRTGVLVSTSRGFGLHPASPGSLGEFVAWISMLTCSFRRERLRPQHNLSRISWGVCHVWISTPAHSFRRAGALASIQPLQDLLGGLPRGSPHRRACFDKRGFGLNPTSPGSPGGFVTWISMPMCSFRRAEALASIQPLQDLLGGLPRVDFHASALVSTSRGFGLNPTSPGSPGGFVAWISMPTSLFQPREASASTQPLQDLLGGLPRVDLRTGVLVSMSRGFGLNLSRISWGVVCLDLQDDVLASASCSPSRIPWGVSSHGSPW